MPIPRTTCHLSRSGGFTLVELMITIAVVAILAAVAMPATTALVNSARLNGQTEELVSSLQLARAEAIRRNARVTICAGAAGTCSGSTSWSNLTMFGRDNTAATTTTDVIRDTSLSASVQVAGPAAGLVYKPSGLIDSQQKLEVDTAGNKRCITVLISGVVSVANGACT